MCKISNWPQVNYFRLVGVLALSCPPLATVGCRSLQPSQLANQYIDFDHPPSPYMPRCKGGKPQAWGQMTIDADLLKVYLRQLSVTSTANVGVVDSGFNALLGSQFAVASPIKTLHGAKNGDFHPTKQPPFEFYSSRLDFFGPANEDESGHGTAVTSVIAGQGDFGVAEKVHVSSFRITPRGAGKGSTFNILEIAAFNACKALQDHDGLVILNLSWGGFLDESGLERDEDSPHRSALYQKAAEQGCLIVKAAGNANYRRNRDASLQAQYLRVASVDESLTLSEFSSEAPVSAPGSDIFVIDSRKQRYHQLDENSCEGQEHRTFINGTSFAAPMVAGVAAMIVRLYKHLGTFKGLSPIQRYNLVTATLRASASQKLINAVKAAAIAERFATLNTEQRLLIASQQDPAPTLLDGYLNSQPDRCQQRAPHCLEFSDFDSAKECMDQSRLVASYCPHVRPEHLVDLSQSLEKWNAWEKAHQIRTQLAAISSDNKILNNLRREALYNHLNRYKFFDQREARTGRPDRLAQSQILGMLRPSFLGAIAIPYFENAIHMNVEDQQLLRQISSRALYTASFLSRLKQGFDPVSGEDRGSNAVEEHIAKLLALAERHLGASALVEILQFRFDIYLKDVQFLIDATKNRPRNNDMFNFVTQVRILRGFGRKTQDPIVKDYIFRTEEKIIDLLRQTHEYNASFMAESIHAYEYYPTRYFFFELVETHQNMLQQSLARGDYARLASFEVFYVFEHLDRHLQGLNDQERWCLSLISLIAQGKGWGELNDREIVSRSLLLLKDLTQMGQDSSPLSQKIDRIVQNAVNGNFLDLWLQLYIANQPLEIDYPNQRTELRPDMLEPTAPSRFRNIGLASTISIKHAAQNVLLLANQLDLKRSKPLDTRDNLGAALGRAAFALLMTEDSAPPNQRELQRPLMGRVYPDRMNDLSLHPALFYGDTSGPQPEGNSFLPVQLMDLVLWFSEYQDHRHLTESTLNTFLHHLNAIHAHTHPDHRYFNSALKQLKGGTWRQRLDPLFEKMNRGLIIGGRYQLSQLLRWLDNLP